jgi:hypothetical protein
MRDFTLIITASLCVNPDIFPNQGHGTSIIASCQMWSLFVTNDEGIVGPCGGILVFFVYHCLSIFGASHATKEYLCEGRLPPRD